MRDLKEIVRTGLSPLFFSKKIFGQNCQKYKHDYLRCKTTKDLK